MTALDASGLAEALADERMLEPEQHEQFVDEMLPVCQDVSILVKELVYRKWLTPFQVEAILAGNVDSLFLGSYVLIEPLGEGGMGRVFRARNWKLNRQVAVKVIREDHARQEAVVARFQREIRALCRIHHPNIVMAIDADLQCGSIWYAMEYVDGIDLGHRVHARGPMPIDDACDCIVQIADALQHAHDCGLVHRDIKPSNLVYCENDRSVKLLDLGLTRSEVPIDDSVFAELTRAGAIIGTPDYMAPEQIKDSRNVDMRSDLYSLGCTFYFLLTGRAPFEDSDAVIDKLIAQCENEPTPLEWLRPSIPPGLGNIVRKLMAKRRRDRFQSSAELIAALLDLQDGSILPAHDTLHNSPAPTLVHGSGRSPRMPNTEILSHFDIAVSEQFEAEEDAPVAPAQNNWMTPARIAVAVVIATLAMVLVWQVGKGPGALRGKPAAADTVKPAPQLEAQPPAQRESVSASDAVESLKS